MTQRAEMHFPSGTSAKLMRYSLQLSYPESLKGHIYQGIGGEGGQEPVPATGNTWDEMPIQCMANRHIHISL